MSEFKKVKEKFNDLINSYENEEISKEELKKSLRELMVRDSEGKLWSLGEKSGHWYYLEEGKWKRGIPQEEIDEEKEGKKCPNCGFLNPSGAKLCGNCGKFFDKKELRCPNCKTLIKSGTNYCPYCGFQVGKKEIAGLKNKEIVKLQFKSFSLFFAGMGLFLGIIFGCYLGVSSVSLAFLNKLPTFFQTIRGGIKGGMLYGVMGAVAGFILFGIIGWLFAGIYNFISFLFGGAVVKEKAK